MTMMSVSCPACGFSRRIPADKVPDGPRRVTCPQCRHVFPFSKEAAVTPQPTGEPAPGTPEPPPIGPKPPAPEEPAPAPRMRPRPAPPKKLMDVGVLFERSWQLFQRRFAVLIGLYLLTIIAFVLPIGITVGAALLAGMTRGGGSVVLVGGIGALVGLYLGFRCFAAFLHAVVDDRLTFREALETGKGQVLPLIWISFLTGFIIAGGFLLLVIPGIIFMVWFFFAQFILIKEELHGIGALLKSREYVRGEWFNVALRLLLVWAASVLLGMVPVAGPILSVAFFPFVMIFHYLVYADLRNLKEDVPFPCGTMDNIRWPAVALLGFVAVPVVLLSFVGFSLKGKLADFAPAAAGISLKSATTNHGGNGDVYRIIDFPEKDGTPAPTDATGTSASSAATASAFPTAAGSEEYPENIHVFIYAVNYTGTVKANGTTIQELEGRPDVQFNYNLNGKGLRYGSNQIDIDYAEVPNPTSSLLGVHLQVSRYPPGKEKEVLGDWRFDVKGSGRKSFTFEIPK